MQPQFTGITCHALHIAHCTLNEDGTFATNRKQQNIGTKDSTKVGKPKILERKTTQNILCWILLSTRNNIWSQCLVYAFFLYIHMKAMHQTELDAKYNDVNFIESFSLFFEFFFLFSVRMAFFEYHKDMASYTYAIPHPVYFISFFVLFVQPFLLQNTNVVRHIRREKIKKEKQLKHSSQEGILHVWWSAYAFSVEKRLKKINEEICSWKMVRLYGSGTLHQTNSKLKHIEVNGKIEPAQHNFDFLFLTPEI